MTILLSVCQFWRKDEEKKDAACDANLIDVILRKRDSQLLGERGQLIHISNWFQPIHQKSILPSFAVNDNVYSDNSLYIVHCTAKTLRQSPQYILPCLIVSISVRAGPVQKQDPQYIMPNAHHCDHNHCITLQKWAIVNLLDWKHDHGFKLKLLTMVIAYKVLLSVRSQAWLIKTITTYLALFSLWATLFAKYMVINRIKGGCYICSNLFTGVLG